MMALRRYKNQKNFLQQHLPFLQIVQIWITLQQVFLWDDQESDLVNQSKSQEIKSQWWKILVKL